MYGNYPKFEPDEILVYLRKSRSDDPALTVEEVLKRQEQVLRDWEARELNAPIPEENWYKEVASGESLKERPQFQKVLKRLEDKQVKGLLCVECQRISRGDLEECGRIINLIRYSDSYVITPYKIYNLSDEYDRDGFERELKRGNDYLEYFKRIQKRGIELSISNGNYLGRVAPYGYRKIKIMVNKKWCPTLEVVPEEAEVVRQIFEWAASGHGVEAIVRMLHDHGYKNASGTTLWDRSSVRMILHNEHYMGKIRYYYRVKKKRVENQIVVSKTERQDEYLLYEGKHEAIISEDLFYRAQAMRDKQPRYKKSTQLSNPLAGLMFCSCGRAMDYKFDGTLVDKETGIRKRRFHCSNQRFCHSGSVKEHLIYNDIINALKSEIDNFQIQINSGDDDIAKQHERHIDYLKGKILEAEKKEMSLWEKYAEDEMPKKIFNKLLEKQTKEKEELEAALEKAYKDTPKKIDYEEKLYNFHQAIDALQDKTVSAEEKNKLLKKCIEKIIYTREPTKKVTREEAKELGVNCRGGWLKADYDLDIYLLI